MSTTQLTHTFGIHDYVHQSFRNEGGGQIFTARPRDGRPCCPQCGSKKVIRKGGTVRRFRMLPIGSRPTFLDAFIPRIHCGACNITRQARLSFAAPRRSYTHQFERFALELLQLMTPQDVARHLQVGWDCIQDIHKRYLSKKYKKPKLRHLRRLAIDEIHVSKKRGFLTVVMDLVTGAVVYVCEGKGAASLEPFFKRLRASKAKIEAVAVDMGAAYNAAVRSQLPEAAIVIDHFHVVKLFNEKLSDYRRDLQSKLEGEQKIVLKGTRWLLLKTPINLNEKKNEVERLQEALALNAPLATAYYMKAELQLIWKQMDKESAAFLFDDWVKRAKASGISMLDKFADTMLRHREGILAYYDFDKMSTGPLEGMNNKIGLLQRKSYGFRDQEFFKLRIMGLHESKIVLTG